MSPQSAVNALVAALRDVARASKSVTEYRCQDSRMTLHTNTIHANVNCAKVFLATLKRMPLLHLKQKHPSKSFPSKSKKKSKQDTEA